MSRPGRGQSLVDGLLELAVKAWMAGDICRAEHWARCAWTAEADAQAKEADR